MILPEEITQPAISLSDGYFDLKGLSIYSSLGVGTIRDYIKSGELPCFKLKGKILVRKSEFDRWIEKHRLNQKRDINSMVSEIFENLRKK